MAVSRWQTILPALKPAFLGEPEAVDKAKANIGKPLEAEEADELGLVTMILDDIDWEDEIRIFMEERASFSPDAMTGMEANLRFAGPETMETRIFGRLTAWQNWIFQPPECGWCRWCACSATELACAATTTWNGCNPNDLGRYVANVYA